MKRILGLLMMLLAMHSYAEVTEPGNPKDTPVDVKLEKGNSTTEDTYPRTLSL